MRELPQILRNNASWLKERGTFPKAAQSCLDGADEIERLRFALKELIDWSAAYSGNPGFDNVRAAAKALLGEDAGSVLQNAQAPVGENEHYDTGDEVLF